MKQQVSFINLSKGNKGRQRTAKEGGGLNRELININVGQAGCNVGAASWELFFLDHGIQADGQFSSTKHIENNAFKKIFSQSQNGNYIPRCAFLDLEPNAIDEIRTGTYRQLFHPEQLISAKENTSNNFAKGHNTIGCRYIDNYLDDTIRKISEKCQNLQGFLIVHSVGGGTGSGLGSLLLERLSDNYRNKSKFSFSIYHSLQDSIMEPYNSILATKDLIENTDVNIILGNEAIYDICKRNLNIKRPTYTNLNRLISQAISSITATLRFDGALSSDLNKLRTNMVPFHRLHFMLPSYSPIISAENAEQLSVAEIINSCFETDNMMAKCDARNKNYFACLMVYRGDVVLQDVNVAIKRVKKTISFADWCPTGLRAQVHNQSPTIIHGGDLANLMRQCSMISNNTAIPEVFSGLKNRFDLMYKRKAFVHHYISESMEESDFIEAQENLTALEKEYKHYEGKKEF